jgi:peptidoglycan/LPS O-acetylase OafA/YrhL
MATGYRADLDGLRAVSVLLVVGFHTFPINVPAGFIGVDVFFVISGYLITGFILDALAAGTFSILEFYTRRARRILPALCVVIAATLAIGWFVTFPAPYKRLGLDAWASALFFPNLIDWSEAGYFDAIAESKPLLHLWSLGVEEQFYLLWPVLLVTLVWWGRRRAAVLCLIGIASFVYSCVAVFHDPVAAFYSPLSRLWELGIGSILAFYPVKLGRQEIVSLTGLAIILVSALVLNDSRPFPGALAMAPAFGTALVIVGRSDTLAWAPLVAVGLISYPLYLWHWPLLSLASTLGFHTELAKGIAVAISVLLAWTTAQFVEYPVRFGSFRSAGVVVSAVSMLFIAASAYIIFLYDGFLVRYPASIRPVLATKEYIALHPALFGSACWFNYNELLSNYPATCRDGDVLIWGDSYAGTLAMGLTKPFAQLIRTACLPLLSEDTNSCARGNVAAFAEIVRLKPKRTILFGDWLIPVANWKNAPEHQQLLRTTLNALRQNGNNVVLVGWSPFWWPSLPDLVYKYWSKSGELPDRLDVVSDKARETDASLREVAESEHVPFVSILDALCNREGCLTHTPASKDELLAFDYGHFTAEGARYLVKILSLDLPRSSDAHLSAEPVQR